MEAGLAGMGRLPEACLRLPGTGSCDAPSLFNNLNTARIDEHGLRTLRTLLPAREAPGALGPVIGGMPVMGPGVVKVASAAATARATGMNILVVVVVLIELQLRRGPPSAFRAREPGP